MSSSIAEKFAGFLLTANKTSHTLGIIDPDLGIQLAEVPVGGITGHEVAASRDGCTAYVPIYGDSGVGKPGSDGRHIAVVDLLTRQVASIIEFDHGVRPHCAVFGPRDGFLYVTTELDRTISVVDPASRKVLAAIPTGQPESHMLAISPDGRRAYVANVGPGTVSILDLASRRCLAVVPISRRTQRISVSSDGALVFTADQGEPRLAVLDTAAQKIKSWIALPSLGFGTTTTPDGRWLLATLPSENQLAVIDLQTLTLNRTLDVPASPQEILIRPDSRWAYVSCDTSNLVAAIRIADWQVVRLIDSGRETDGLAWAPRAE